MNTKFWENTKKMYKNGLKKEKKKKKDVFVDYGVAKRRFEGQICSEKSGDMPFSSPREIFFSFFFNRATCIDLTNICTKGEGLKRLRSREMNWYVSVS